MAKIKAIFVGCGALAARLEGLTNAEAKRAIGSACREALKPMLADARSNAPSKTGNLKRSMRIKTIRSRKKIGARITMSGSSNEYSGKTFYGAFQEFGFKTGSRKGRAQVAKAIAKRLRTTSRLARDGTGKGLAKKGSEFRAKQEAYFEREGNRLSASHKPKARRQIAPKSFLKKAAQSRSSDCIDIFNSIIGAHIKKVIGKRK